MCKHIPSTNERTHMIFANVQHCMLVNFTKQMLIESLRESEWMREREKTSLLAYFFYANLPFALTSAVWVIKLYTHTHTYVRMQLRPNRQFSMRLSANSDRKCPVKVTHENSIVSAIKKIDIFWYASTFPSLCSHLEKPICSIDMSPERCYLRVIEWNKNKKSI